MGREARANDTTDPIEPETTAIPIPNIGSFPTPGAPGIPALSFEQLTQMMAAAVAAGVKASTTGAADLHAEAMKRALKPENAMSPMKSVYNPAGDADHPRPALKAVYTLFDGIPIDGTTDTVEELELFNQLEQGEYLVDRSDGSKMMFRVTEHRNDLGVLQRVNIWFPYRDAADVAAVMPMRVWLKDVVSQIADRRLLVQA